MVCGFLLAHRGEQNHRAIISAQEADQFFRQTSDEAATKIVSAGGTEDLIKAGEVAFDRLVG
jgi:hypothetical protein